MDTENPYQSPMASSSEDSNGNSDASYSAETCPNCDADVTFWVALKQPTPFWFTCARCRSKYRVQTPFMRLVFVAVVCVGSLFVFAVYLAIERLGFVVLVACVPILVAAWFALELWTYRYIKRRGTFVQMRTGKRTRAPESAAGPVVNGESSPPTR